MVLYGVSMALPFVVLVPAVTSEGVCLCCLQFRTGSQVLGGLCPCPAVFSLFLSIVSSRASSLSSLPWLSLFYSGICSGLPLLLESSVQPLCPVPLLPVQPWKHCILRKFLCKYYNFCKWLSSLELSPVLTSPFFCVNLLPLFKILS